MIGQTAFPVKVCVTVAWGELRGNRKRSRVLNYMALCDYIFLSVIHNRILYLYIQMPESAHLVRVTLSINCIQTRVYSQASVSVRLYLATL